jgi:hypothetical protein
LLAFLRSCLLFRRFCFCLTPLAFVFPTGREQQSVIAFDSLVAASVSLLLLSFRRFHSSCFRFPNRMQAATYSYA